MTIYGPYQKRTDVSGFQKIQSIYRQKPITSAPVPYQVSICMNVFNNPGYKSWNTSAIDILSNDWKSVIQRARNRFVGAAHAFNFGGEDAQLGASLGEWRQAHHMIATRSFQILEIIRLLRRGNVTAAARRLGIRYKGKEHIRDLSSLWLEWHYGWAPLVQDIGNSVDTLQSPLSCGDSLRAVGRASGLFYYHWPAPSIYSGTWSSHCRISATIVVSNKNLFLANKLGFVNPASIVWELVPFSFVVDWFVNVGDFLNSYTDFVGLTLKDPCTTYFGKHDFFDDPARANNWKGRQKRLVQVQRVLNIPSGSIVVKPISIGLSPMRAANAIALLTQGLKSLRS